MSGFPNTEITYKVVNKSSKKKDLRCFSLPRISSLKQLQETIQKICKPKKDYWIYWKNYNTKIPIQCDEELKAAHEIMMIKNCRCRICRYQSFGKESMNQACSGSGNIILYIKYLNSESKFCLSLFELVSLCK